MSLIYQPGPKNPELSPVNDHGSHDLGPISKIDETVDQDHEVYTAFDSPNFTDRIDAMTVVFSNDPKEAPNNENRPQFSS
ncbi:MAG TPA: hypothetical protein VNE40_01560 [Candidatus Dormibacteraeota bacterium]|nr:hypothetical protein [Candidatus Dormibacteraeota bacterium]